MEQPPAPSSFESLGPSLRAAPLGTAVLRSHVDRRPYQRLYLVMLFFLALMVLCYVRDERLPAPQQLDAAIAKEPLQEATSVEPFDKSVDGEQYHLVPMASYDITALVVSAHDSRTWWDYIHKEAGDFINVNDLCVVWGPDATSGLYLKASFSNSEFSCQWSAPDSVIHALDYDGISNNHLLTEDRFAARELRDVRIGDQIRIRGYLVNYANKTRAPQSYRNTSLVRTDTGDGACEIIYVKDLTVLHAGTRLWLILKYVCALALVCCAGVWLALPYRGKV
jgi:hypothetical protein